MYEQSDIHPYLRAAGEKSLRPWTDRLKTIWTSIWEILTPEVLLIMATAFLLARAQILGGLYPFAGAFIAAQALLARQYVTYALFGALCALPITLHGVDIVVQGGVYILIASLVYFYNQGSRRIIFFPLIIAAVNIVVKGTAITFTDGTDYNVMVVLFESMLLAGFTPVLYVALRAEPWNKEGEHLTAEEYICFLLLVMALIMGVGDFGYQFVTLKGVISRYCILLAAWLGGPGAGAAVGVLVGIIPSLANAVAPSIVGNFAFSGLLAGVFKTFNKLGIIIGFILANLLLSIYYLNQPAVLGALVECILAAMLFLITPLKVYYRLAVLGNEDKNRISKQEEITLRETAVTHLQQVSETFNDMARSFSHAAYEEKSDKEELNKLFGTVSRLVCQDCAIHKICWENDYRKTCKSILELFKYVETKGFINFKLINPDIKKRCSRMREMVATISCIYENYRINGYWMEKFAENRELLASQMRGMAGITIKLSGELSGSIKTKQALQSTIAQELEKEGLFVDRVKVVAYSDKNTEILIDKEACHGMYDCPKIVAKTVSRLAGIEFIAFDGTCSLQNDSKQCNFKLVPKGSLRITHAVRQLAKEGSNISGDTTICNLLKDGRQLLLISDGMGGGQVAALESQVTASLLEQLLEAGFDKEVALKTVNAALLGRKGKESFATVDLVVIDLVQSEMELVKVAAPPSYIKRGNKVISIKTGNLPIGIVNTIEIETMHEKLRKSDYLIMVTDGVLDAIPVFNKEEWLAESIRDLQPGSPGDMSDELLRKVISIANGKVKDDMTILIAYLY